MSTALKQAIEVQDTTVKLGDHTSDRVYKYGAVHPDEESKALFFEQMRLAKEYQNRCIEEINTKRRAVRESVGDPPHPLGPEGCGLMTEDGKKKMCDDCKAFWKNARAEARKIGFYDFKPLRTEFSAKGLRHGAYSAAEDAVKAAEKNAGKKRGWKYGDPLALLRFKSWRRHKHLTRVQVFERTQDKWFRLEDANLPGRRPKKILWLRVGSDASRNPVWAKIQIVYHRPIQGKVAWAAVHYSPRDNRWWVTFVCKGVPARSDSAKAGTVAVDVGWRKIEGEIRLAYANDGKGNIEEFRLPAKWVGAVSLSERLQGHRKDLLNELQAEIPELAIYRSSGGVQRWLRENPETPHRDRIMRFVHRDRHLAQYLRGVEKYIVGRRRDALRVFVRKLRRRYQSVVIKNTSHKEMKETSTLHGRARTLGQHASPGETIAEFTKVFSDAGAVFRAEAEYTSCTCPECHHVGEVYSELSFVCERCMTALDRDEVSTRNMLFDLQRGAVEDATVRKRPPRFAKRHKNREGGGNACAVAS